MNITETNKGFINTQELLQLVNEARKRCGEPSIRNNKSLKR